MTQLVRSPLRTFRRSRNIWRRLSPKPFRSRLETVKVVLTDLGPMTAVSRVDAYDSIIVMEHRRRSLRFGWDASHGTDAVICPQSSSTDQQAMGKIWRPPVLQVLSQASQGGI